MATVGRGYMSLGGAAERCCGSRTHAHAGNSQEDLLSALLLQGDFEKRADRNDPRQQALLDEMRAHVKKVS